MEPFCNWVNIKSIFNIHVDTKICKGVVLCDVIGFPFLVICADEKDFKQENVGQVTSITAAPS